MKSALHGGKISLDEVNRIREGVRKLLTEDREKLGIKTQIAAHDIFNVISVGTGYLELLDMQGSNKDTSEAIKNVLDEIRTMKKEVSSTFFPEDVEIHRLISEEISRALAKNANRGIYINKNLEEVKANVDKYLIRALVRNLINNSIQNMVENKTPEKCVKVTLKDNGDHILIIHEDTGTGIKEGIDPFAGKTGRPGRGTGTGGKIIKKVVEMHNGEITWENKPEGGTRFVIKIPKRRRAR